MSNFLPTQLSILKEYVPSAEETAALVSHAKTEVHSIVHQPRFNGVRENSLQMSSIIIDAIANKWALWMNYVGKVDEEEEIGGNILIHAETKRLIVPITIGEVDYIPGSVIWKKWHEPKWPTSVMNKPHKHLKMLAYQVAGYSSSDTETGFKTFDIDGVRRLQEVDDSENIDFREIDERFVLDAGVRTRYILQYSQLRLQKYRDQLLALFPKK